ncbi:hypothetical protein DBR40_25545 [Pedobacter sp. KBW01]|nr:hypothetical protein DBR40_25545 [Pedobacter sp. KBW01]
MDKIISKTLDIFFPLFKKVMTKEVYRFLAVGGVCFFLNFCIFHSSYFFLYKDNFHPVKPHTLALLSSLSITIFVGYFLNRSYVFVTKEANEQRQFFRYFLTTILNVLISIYLLDFLIMAKINVTIAFILNVVIVQTINFFVQKNFSFKTAKIS